MLVGIRNATVVTPTEVIEDGAVHFSDGVITDVVRDRRTTLPRDGMLDAGGRYLLPGLVDVHSDDIEKQFEPRAGVAFPEALTFLELDRHFSGCGITTVFHAISLKDRERRGMGTARTLCRLVLQYGPHGRVHHELHARCELSQEASVRAVLELLREEAVPIVSLMDHTPGQGKYRDPAWLRRHSEQYRQASDAELARVLAEARRDGDAIWTERAEQVAQAARARGAVLFSHDDHDPEQVDELPPLGVSVSEFPISQEVTQRARQLGLAVCMGAPNVVRGCSHGGSIAATEAVRQGLVDMLCSDYHPPSLLHAAFRLARERVTTLPAAVALVTAGPAKAAGLADRGQIRLGALADLIVVGARLGLPSVTHTIVAGSIVATG